MDLVKIRSHKWNYLNPKKIKKKLQAKLQRKNKENNDYNKYYYFKR